MGSGQDRHVHVAILIGVIAVAVRLVAINQPFVDRWSWRQCDVAAIARNYLEHGFRFAYPQIDWAGDQPGYVGTEFPVLPFVAAVCYKFLGVHEWIGRSQGVVLFAISLPFFFLLVREIFGATAATWALFFYSFAPLSVMASRCFMPDMPSLSLSIVGLCLFYRWTGTNEKRFFFISAISISLSILLKAPSAIVGLPLAYVCYQRFGFSALRRVDLWIFGAIALAPSALWYWHACQIAWKFYPYHLFGEGGTRIMSPGWYAKIAGDTVIWSLTAVMFIMALPGLFASFRNRGTRLFHWWLAAALLFIMIVGYGNRHCWYQLALVPIFATFAGFTCSRAREFLPFASRLPFVAVLVVAWFCLLSYVSLKRWYFESAADLAQAGLELKGSTDSGSLIVAADYGDPTIFYYAERKGWHFLEKHGVYNGHPTTSADAIGDLENLERRGATHLVFYSGAFWWLEYYKEFAEYLAKETQLIETTPQIRVFRLKPVQDRQ